MEEHKQDARQDAIDMAYYVTDADRDDATKFVDLVITACARSLAASVGNIEREQDTQAQAAIARIDKIEASLDALQLESDRRWATREDVVASRLDKLDACAVYDAGLIQTLHERMRILEGKANRAADYISALESCSEVINRRLDSMQAGLTVLENRSGKQAESTAATRIQIDSLYRRLNNLELLGKGLTDISTNHKRHIDELRNRTDVVEPGKDANSGKQADVLEETPIGPDRSPERLIGIIADLNLHLTDIISVLERSSDASGILKMECGKDSYLQWRRLASKACDNAKAVL